MQNTKRIQQIIPLFYSPKPAYLLSKHQVLRKYPIYTQLFTFYLSKNPSTTFIDVNLRLCFNIQIFCF